MSDNRSILDTIVQGSTVELFHANDIAVAPIARCNRVQPLNHEYQGGLIGFVGRGFSGTLLILVPHEIFLMLRQDGPRPYREADWVRELANQLLGRLKIRLRQFQVTFRVGIPSTSRREEYERLWDRETPLAVYRFRTIKDDIIVVINGNIDGTNFVYCDSTKPATEGDIIIF